MGAVLVLGEAERPVNRGDKLSGLVQAGQVDQADPVREAARRPGRRSQRQSRLTNPRRPGDRDEPRPPQQRAQPGEFRLPPDETGYLGGQLSLLLPLMARGLADEHAILTRSKTRFTHSQFCPDQFRLARLLPTLLLLTLLQPTLLQTTPSARSRSNALVI